jgi:phosphonate transport system permease protein
MSASPLPLRNDPRFWLGLAFAASAASLLLLPWDLSAIASGEALGRSWARLGEFVSAFRTPDLSPSTLRQVGALLVDTAAIAVLGMALGLLLALPLAMLASRAVMLGEPQPGRRLGTRIVVGCARIALDVLRGIPDFAWVLLLVGFTGLGACTGIGAIALSVGGILGKVASEQWDNLPPERYRALWSTGASRSSVFLYAILPLSARQLASFVLMRGECALRNASVIGAVGGGGLGASLWEAFKDSRYELVATTLLALVLLTATADLLANVLRRHFRSAPDPDARTSSRQAVRRRRLLLATLLASLVVASAVWLAPEWRRLVAALTSLDLGFSLQFVRRLLLSPDLGAIPAALRESLLPIAIAVVSTLAATLLAATFSYPASLQFQRHASLLTGERNGPLSRALGVVSVLTTRGLALIGRAIPEVAWVLIFGAFFRLGTIAALLAVTVHTAAVLLRVFTETVDDLPAERLQALGLGCRRRLFLYGALPAAWPNWRSYAFLQFESNLRLGIVLGMVGLGGLGEAFDGNLRFDRLERASTFLWAMVALTILADRLGRAFAVRRLRC